jgi:hypothetical protein
MLSLKMCASHHAQLSAVFPELLCVLVFSPTSSLGYLEICMLSSVSSLNQFAFLLIVHLFLKETELKPHMEIK